MMTHERLIDRHLAQAYRRDVLGKPYQLPQMHHAMIPMIKERIAKIDALRLGASLASRDFVSYQNRRALVRLLEELEAQAKATGESPGTS